MTNRVWFDARSLSRGYTSGWERYVRELSIKLPNLIDITLWNPMVKNRINLLLSDYVYNKSQIGHSLVHFPTYPPTKLNISHKNVITIHDLTWWNFPETSSFLGKNYYKKYMEKAIQKSDLIVTPSLAIKNELNKKFSINLNKIISISHGNSLPQGTVSKPAQPYFLSVGTIEPRKNLDFYSKAIDESKLKNNFDFIHVGRTGWGSLPKNLKLQTVNNDKDLANLILNAQAVVIPSLYEGFGLPLLESHAQGTPVILSNDPALIELSSSQDKIFELENVKTLVDSLLHFSNTNEKLSIDLINEANSFTWEKSAQSYVETYLRLLNE
jgi:glycosyltransferase involved in cell wall biosynthesis